ncbi:MAG: alkaline phosphatase family protein [bacterium]
MRIRLAWLAVLAVVGAIGGCGGDPKSARGSHRAPDDPPRLVILGVDGFDWNIVDPLVAAGRMPEMEKLQAEGTRADLLTLVPLEKSPVIWTSIATGKLPEQQGRGFLIESGPDSAKAYTAWNRSTRAFWNILSDLGWSVSVLGWLETWPAERVHGTIVSDYVQYDVAERAKRARFRHRTYPEELIPEIEPLVVYPKDVSDEDLAPFLTGTVTAESPDNVRFGFDDLRWIWSGDLTFTAIAEDFLDHRREDVMAIYLRGPDAVCHKFWGAREDLAAGRDDPMAQVFGETVDRYFEATDTLLGRILDKIDLTRTTLVLVSDHGFQGGRQALDGSPRLGVWMHRELGTVLVAGPAAAGAGLRVEGARVIDVLPTVLHALGLPVAEDFDGEVARPLLDEEGGRDRAVRTVPTFETGEPPEVPRDTESPVDEQIRERLESLSYIE